MKWPACSVHKEAADRSMSKVQDKGWSNKTWTKDLRDLIKIFTKEDFIPDIEDNYMKKKKSSRLTQQEGC